MAARRNRLAERRIALGYSQEGLAEAVGVATSTIVRWEAGRATPQPYMRPKIARLLKATPEELDSLLVSSPEPIVQPPVLLADGDPDDMLRRDVLALIAATGALIALPGTAAAAEPVGGARPRSADAATVLWQAYRLADHKRDVEPLVRQQIARLAESLARPLSGSERLRLCSQGADLYQLAGEIAFDANRYEVAAQCYTLAASAAKEAGAMDMWACALTRHAFTYLYDRRPAGAVPLLEAALRIAEQGDPQLSTRYWVASVQAEAYAGVGDADECLRALDQADQVGNLSGEFQNGGWLRFDGSRLYEQRGVCHLALGHADAAERYLSVAVHQGLSARRQGAVLAGLAELGARHRDVDRVVHYSGAALDLADRTGSGYIVRKLDSLRGPLAPLMADPRVSNLTDQITYRGAAS
ncbi:helix-turn-helix domain-containing protein [Kitasatospora sp. NBC_01287]|uniref:helix-turn-helix transcriptional regulator n=1 Tax=Kitasatospora sp. NBC_01287 TaxID=2903573 RepID=UPI00224ECF40|nr:helix-turn-helix transcriptional regulator [Kitasatospora sp. NBC_01287]MCX4745909.1 helix-turn-helix domain-containing protein [Kitasatospora sp. NBC_01287]